MAFPTVAPREEFSISLLDANLAVLATYELVDYTGGAYEFNQYPMRRYGSSTQAVKGDGTAKLSNLKFLIRGTGHPQAVQRQLYRRLLATKHIQFGAYRLQVASAAGFNSLEMLTPTEFTAEIEIIPASAYWTDGLTTVIAVM
jgi:hypothetical protein